MGSTPSMGLIFLLETNSSHGIHYSHHGNNSPQGINFSIVSTPSKRLISLTGTTIPIRSNPPQEELSITKTETTPSLHGINSPHRNNSPMGSIPPWYHQLTPLDQLSPWDQFSQVSIYPFINFLQGIIFPHGIHPKRSCVEHG